MRENQELSEWYAEFNALITETQEALAECGSDETCITETRAAFNANFRRLLRRLGELEYGYRYVYEIIAVATQCAAEASIPEEIHFPELEAMQFPEEFPQFPELEAIQFPEELPQYSEMESFQFPGEAVDEE